MMEELQRRHAEAARQHREEEARRLAAIYSRLSSTLKFSGLPELRMKGDPGEGPGLKLKLGDSAGGHARVKGLPGIYLNDGQKPYGIPGLPGVYTGGPGEGSGLAAPGLKLKTGEETEAKTPPGRPESGDRPVDFDPSKMTPQQLAEVAEQVGKLPPEVQERLLFMAQDDAAAGRPAPSPQPAAPVSLGQQGVASQAAASAPVPEDASWKAGEGFDRPLGPEPVYLDGTNLTPKLLRPETPARP